MVEKKLDDVAFVKFALVTKRLVEVALVEVEMTLVRLRMVDDASE